MSSATVVGGGAVGLSFALAAANTDRRIALVIGKKSPANQFFALSAASRKFLARCDAWSEIAESSLPVSEMRLFADGNSVRIDSLSAGVAQLCHIADGGAVLNSLMKKISGNPRVKIFRGEIANFESDESGVSVALADGENWRTNLLVGADGVHSKVADIAGISADIFSYQQRAITAILRASRPHRRAAFQWFGESDTFALLPVRQNHFAMVWSMTEKNARKLAESDAQAIALHAENRAKKFVGELRAEGKIGNFPLVRIRRPKTTARRVVLIGDSAHVIHPLAGQGLNLGFGDAAALVDIISESGDCGGDAILSRHEKRRRPAVWAMGGFADFARRNPSALSAAFCALKKMPMLGRFAVAAANR